MQEWTVNDMRLGDLDALYDHVKEEQRRNPHCGHIERIMHNHEHESFLRDIFLAPTIDAVPVVRCKDCKRCDGFPEPDDIQPNEIGICRINMLAVKPEGFCSYGERKDGEG